MRGMHGTQQRRGSVPSLHDIILTWNSPRSPGTDAGEDVRWFGPRLEVGRVRHWDEAGAGGGGVRVPDPIRVAQKAGVGEVSVDGGAIADGALDGRRDGEGGDGTEEGKKSGREHRVGRQGGEGYVFEGTDAKPKPKGDGWGRKLIAS